MLKFSGKPTRSFHICHTCDMFNTSYLILFKLFLPQCQKPSSLICFESLQFMIFISTVTEGTSTDILYTVMRTIGHTLMWVLVELSENRLAVF